MLSRSGQNYEPTNVACDKDVTARDAHPAGSPRECFLCTVHIHGLLDTTQKFLWGRPNLVFFSRYDVITCYFIQDFIGDTFR